MHGSFRKLQNGVNRCFDFELWKFFFVQAGIPHEKYYEGVRTIVSNNRAQENNLVQQRMQL